MSSLLEMAEQLRDSFSSGLLVFWPAAWSLTLVAMESRMAPAEYARQLGIFLLQTTVGYNLGNAWEEIGAYCCLRSGPTRTDKPGEENTRGMSAIIALSELLIFSTFVWSLNTYAFWNALLCLVVVSAISPLMKRVSYRSSVVLSLAMNWFLVVAWVANHNVDWTVLTTLFLTSWSWAHHYDSYRGTSDNMLDSACICVAGLTAVGLVAKQDSPYFLLSVLGGASQLAWQLLTTDFDDPKSRLSAFVSNGTCFGPIVWSGLLINYLNAVATAEYI